MSNQGIHFINHTVSVLKKELQIQHKKSTPYRLQENKIVEAFNKILEHALTKVCNANRDDWDMNIPAVTVGISHHLQDINGEKTIQISIWERDGHSYGLHCSQSVHYNKEDNG